MNIRKSEYIKISKVLVQKFFNEKCFGEGSLYIETIKHGFPHEYLNKVETVLESLVRQDICAKKKKQHGWKYHLNKDRLDKIMEIIR